MYVGKTQKTDYRLKTIQRPDKKGLYLVDNRPVSQLQSELIACIRQKEEKVKGNTGFSGVLQRVSRDDYKGKERQKFNLIIKKLRECRGGLSDIEIDRILRNVEPHEMNMILSWSDDKINRLPWNLAAFDILHAPASFMEQGRYSAMEMDDFRARLKKERYQELAGLHYDRHFVADFLQAPEDEKSRSPISESKVGERDEEQAHNQSVHIGVSFRTESMGKAHTDYDLQVIQSMKTLISKYSPMHLQEVALPRGAQGAATPKRQAEPDVLDGIDMLYIPGGPAANDTQVGTTKKEIEYNRALPCKDPGPEGSKKKQQAYRLYTEHASRSPYELELIRRARLKGIPILAVCGGSWRLLQSFGGRSRTLDKGVRDLHHRSDFDEAHTAEVLPDKLLGRILSGTKVPQKENIKLAGVNSTHWAVADVDKQKQLIKAMPDKDAQTTSQSTERPQPEPGPGDMLDIAAWSVHDDRSTVEAFEAKAGAPVFGIQWHPETYLEGMPGYKDASEENRQASARIFRFMAYAAQAAHNRQLVVEALKKKSLAYQRLQQKKDHPDKEE